MSEIIEHYSKELRELLWGNGLNPTDEQINKLAIYADLLVNKNSFINLVSRKDIKSVIENHIFICAYLTKFLNESFTNFLDIGTGGGLPGIPLGIMNPLLRGVLVDSTAKKINSVAEFIENIKANNIIAVNQRVESYDFIGKYKNRFDLVVSRATVPLAVLIRYSLPLINKRAFIFSMKGGELGEEFRLANNLYKSNISKHTIFELSYKPNNIKNEKEKKVIMVELVK